MVEFDLTIQGGRVVSPGVVGQADIGIRGGVIAALGDLSYFSTKRTIDAHGLVVFPGGVDPHTHVRWPFLGATSADDFRTASIAALFGGTTTIVDWALPVNDSAMEGISERKAAALGDGVIVDFGLHCVLGPAMSRGYAEIPEAVSAGHPTFKCYLTYRRRGLLTDDAHLIEALAQARDLGAIVGVHAENPAIHERAEEQLVSQGKTDAIHFRQAKGITVEAEAINRAIFLAERLDAPLLIQHVSTAEGVALIRSARHRGAQVLAETCPHYLILTDEVYEREDGHRFICSPPVKRAEDRDALWEGLADGAVAFVGADHCAFTTSQKDSPDSAFDVPNGLPGIETRFPLVYSNGVAAGRLSESRFAEVIAENAARVNGIYPQKGRIAVGSDADLTLVDPSAQRTITASELHQGTDWTPYEGITVSGWPVCTVLRGEVVIESNTFKPPSTTGRFLAGAPGGHIGVR